MVDKETNILFQGIRVLDDSKELRNSLFFILSTPGKRLQIRKMPQSVKTGRIESALLEVASIVVGFTLYMIGGRVPNDFELSDSISWLEIKKGFNQWGIGKLPSPCADPVIGVYDIYLYILPEVWKFGYHRVDEDKYLTGREGYIWNTIENKCLEIRIRPPKVGEKRQWRRIRACAALDRRGLLIAMDGERKNFFLHNPEREDWEICDFKDPLPKFIGETSFAESNGRLYILEVRGQPPAFLYIYDIKKGQIVMDKMPIRKFDDYLWLMDEWDRVVRIVPVADDKLCFLWLGPLFYENENMWPPVRVLNHLNIEFSIAPDPAVKAEVLIDFSTNITDLSYCLPCSESFSEEVKNNTSNTALYVPSSSPEEISFGGEPLQKQPVDCSSREKELTEKRKRTELEDEIRSVERRVEMNAALNAAAGEHRRICALLEEEGKKHVTSQQIDELEQELANWERAHLESKKAVCAFLEQRKKEVEKEEEEEKQKKKQKQYIDDLIYGKKHVEQGPSSDREGDFSEI